MPISALAQGRRGQSNGRDSPEVNVFAVRDATLNATAVVGRRSQPVAVLRTHKHVVVSAAWNNSACEA